MGGFRRSWEEGRALVPLLKSRYLVTSLSLFKGKHPDKASRERLRKESYTIKVHWAHGSYHLPANILPARPHRLPEGFPVGAICKQSTGLGAYPPSTHICMYTCAQTHMHHEGEQVRVSLLCFSLDFAGNLGQALTVSLGICVSVFVAPSVALSTSLSWCLFLMAPVQPDPQGLANSLICASKFLALLIETGSRGQQDPPHPGPGAPVVTL